MEPIERAASAVLVEAFDEAVGLSKRTWALMLLAFVLGGAVVGALVVKYRRRSDSDTVDLSSATVAAAGPSVPEAPVRASAWSRGRARVARTDAAMRARVIHAASSLNFRQRRPNKSQAVTTAS